MYFSVTWLIKQDAQLCYFNAKRKIAINKSL